MYLGPINLNNIFKLPGFSVMEAGFAPMCVYYRWRDLHILFFLPLFSLPTYFLPPQTGHVLMTLQGVQILIDSLGQS